MSLTRTTPSAAKRRAPARVNAKQPKVRKPARRRETASAPTGDNRRSKRLALLLRAGTEEFLKYGYEGASLRRIVEQAGGSSATLYQHFGDKNGLFLACAQDLCRQFMKTYKFDLSDSASASKELYAFGVVFLRNFLTPANIGIYRMMIAETPRFPNLGRTMMANGYERVAAGLSAFLRHQTELGTLRIKNFDLAARQFIDLLHGGFQYRQLVLCEPAPSLSEIREAARESTRVFCKGYSA